MPPSCHGAAGPASDDLRRLYSGGVPVPIRAAAGAGALALLVTAAVTATPAYADTPRPHREVEVFVGTGGTPPWLHGGTTPAATAPFGMLQLGPDTTADPGGAPSQNPSGYAAGDPLLRGLSPTHLSGAGCRAFGDAPLLPLVGEVPADPGTATVPIERETERARPGRYDVGLGNGVEVTAAAGTDAGLLRLRYPLGEQAIVLVKADGSLAGTSATRVRFPSDREVAVRADSGGFCGADNAYTVHVRYRFDRPFAARGTWDGGAWARFAARPDGTQVVKAQVAISYVDGRGARRNLDRADPGWSVQRLARRTAGAWDTELDRIEPRGGSPTQRRLLRTAVYHALLHPTPISDLDGRHPGFDGAVQRLSRAQRRTGERQLSSISGWDLYRTTMPLLAWVRPDIASMTVRSLRRAAVQGGWLPRWPVVAADAKVMGGDPAAPIAATAWAFGARDFPLADVVDRLVLQGDRVDGPRTGLADYLRLGWVPTPGLPRGASLTLEYAVADFAISRLASAVGRAATAARYRARSGQWAHLLDPERGLLLPRGPVGAFPPPGADVTACCTGFEEGNALQYTFGGVPHDMAGLLAGLGPDAAVAARLDAFFAHLNSGGEPGAWLGNEPSFLSPWAYHWLGRPARTQAVLDRARAELWSLSPDGLPGNDDLGALSAWYVWATIGLYPVTPGTATVAVSRPAFRSVVVRPRGGAPTRIAHTGPGAAVVGLRVDGRPRSASWLDLRPVRRPARIEVVTADSPDDPPSWGTGPGDRPPSYPGDPSGAIRGE